ncbi:hypothetical protein [Anaerococcus hydrogenalis]|uniref:Putative lipoprotein n=1 Tax=Anaerococcus hydrogenalis ACS-025-V-Sch4 TaxID=879306 RepID=F0GY77_9FIRM|nr:hypothetical protein [Anaerococcus hydrogenalis]EGC84917.1 putative lipoprotein [Anaerococcus hydrogenalis ACS-025-V-Sch4]
MIKKIFIGLSLLIFLTGCGKSSKRSDDSVEIYNKASLENKDNNLNSNEKSNTKEAVKKVKDPYQEIYKQIEGIKFYLSGGSEMESIYFYKDGYFDGALKTGDGYEIKQAFYNGKFDIVEKIDHTSYKIKLVRLDYDSKTGEKSSKNINGTNFQITNIKTDLFDNENKNYILHLPDTKTASLNEDIITGMKMAGNNYGQDKIGIFLLTKEVSEGESFVMSQYKK